VKSAVELEAERQAKAAVEGRLGAQTQLTEDMAGPGQYS
jgi:hypothetical protein